MEPFALLWYPAIAMKKKNGRDLLIIDNGVKLLFDSDFPKEASICLQTEKQWKITTERVSACIAKIVNEKSETPPPVFHRKT